METKLDQITEHQLQENLPITDIIEFGGTGCQPRQRYYDWSNFNFNSSNVIEKSASTMIGDTEYDKLKTGYMC